MDSKTRNEKYSGMTDEELISMSRDGDQEAMEKLLEKYKGMVLGKARSMYILGGDSDDLIQEGMLGLFKAVRDYDCGRDASFSTFAQLCVTRQLYTAVKASARKKHLPLNTAVSLSRPLRESGEGEDEEFMDCLEADASSNIDYRTTINEYVYIIQFEECVTNVWSYSKTIVLLASIVAIIPTNYSTDSPIVTQCVANFGKDSHRCSVSIIVSPCSQRTAKINLSTCS